MVEMTLCGEEHLHTLVNHRPGETKLGERMQCAETTHWHEALRNSPAPFVLLGIPEDIGVRANFGVGGAHTLWEPALRYIANVQDTEGLQGKSILLLGSFDFSELMATSVNKPVAELRNMVALIDDFIVPVIAAIIAEGKIPIVIGGGHNNSYPLLKGTSMALHRKVNCINLDAHSDYRQREGRHSGNGFRYAQDDGYLDRYAMVGLHENYNPAGVVGELKSHEDLLPIFYEDIFLRDNLSFAQALKQALDHSPAPRGIELDMDCIENTLSSAMTPCGLSTIQARQYVATCASAGGAKYLHIAEGATELSNGRKDDQTAKLAAYLVTDFVRNYRH
jgi:formiminoglutamase